MTQQDLENYQRIIKENETMKFEVGMKVTPIKKSANWKYNSIEEFIEYNKSDCCAIFLKENGYLEICEIHEEYKELKLTCGCENYWVFSFDDVVPYKGKIKNFKLGEPSIILEDTTTGEIVFKSKKLEDYTMDELKQEIDRREEEENNRQWEVVKDMVLKMNTMIKEIRDRGYSIDCYEIFTARAKIEEIEIDNGFKELKVKYKN